MVKVLGNVCGKEKEFDFEGNFLLTNSKGGFFALGERDFSKYQGLFFNEGMEFFKSVDKIYSEGLGDIERVMKNLCEVIVKRKNGSERYFFPKSVNALVYSKDVEGKVNFRFDCRKIFDVRTWGRNYSVTTQDGAIVLKFLKETDEREDKSEGEKEYEIFTAIYFGEADYELRENWSDVYYEFDARRNDGPHRSVFGGLSVNTNVLSISSSTDIHTAISQAKNAFDNENKLIVEAEREFCSAKKLQSVDDENIDFAFAASVEALESMVVTQGKSFGIYAGLPWFGQFWTRDTLLSLKPFMYFGNYEFVKKVLYYYLEQVDNGALANRTPHSELKSADALGLLFLAFDDFITELERVGELERYIMRVDRVILINKLRKALEESVERFSKDGLIVSGENETWMDTDGRSGARVEIQALYLRMFNFLKRLSSKLKDLESEKYARDNEEELLNRVRDKFLHEYLFDSPEDGTIRPNIFLAYYFYPEMMTKKEWTRCFDFALNSLWMNWGGIATINKFDSRFCVSHTGANNFSYHKGDSWFYLNNLTALVLARFDKTKYRYQIDKILEASTHEIVSLGFFGYHAELSSASFLESNGCLAQLWSSAFYVELVRELFFGD